MSLVSELNNIADELVECHTNLKNNLIAKGVECSEEDKMSSLIDKVKDTQYIEGYNKLPKWYTSFKVEDYWFECESMSIGRANLTSSVVGEKIYILGGRDKVNSITSSNECYDTKSNNWYTMKNMTTAREVATSSAVDNKIYVIGGYNSSGFLLTNECYDPSTDTWTTKKSMNNYRGGLTSSVVNDKIYCICGMYVNQIYHIINECYDPSTDTWTTMAPSTCRSRTGLTSSVVNDKIYCIGGYYSSGSVYYSLNINECYNPSTNTWTVMKSMGDIRSNLVSDTVNDKIYCINGEYINGSVNYKLNINECYDPNTDTWTTMRSTKTKKAYSTSSAVDGRIYVLGGRDSDNEYLSTNECYIP